MTTSWLLFAWLAGCGGTAPEADTPSEEARARAPKGKAKAKGRKAKGKAPEVEKVPVQVVFLDRAAYDEGREPYLVAVERKVSATNSPRNAVWTLFKGPNDAEKERGLTLVTSGATGFTDLSVADGVATLKLKGGCASEGATITVYDLIHDTLVSFDEIEHVKLLDPKGETADPEGEGDSRPACLEP